MSDDRYRRLARRGLAPWVEDVSIGPTWDELLQPTPTSPAVTQRATSWAMAGGAAAVVVAVVGAAALLSGDEPSSTSTTLISGTVPDVSEVFAPPVRIVDGMTELDLTFLDGTQMTLTYPTELDLTSRGVEAQAVGRLSGGVSRVFGIRYGPPEAFVTETEDSMGPGDLATTFPAGDGSLVELWEFPREPLAYLVFDFDPWTAYVWDGMGGANPALSDEGRASWAESLSGAINDQGFLILSADPPLELVPAAENPGPDGPDLRIDGSSGSLLIFVNDCDRMTSLDEEAYGTPVFAFCDVPTNTLFFVGGDAATQQRVHETLRVHVIESPSPTTTTSSTEVAPTPVPETDAGVWERLEPAPITGRRWQHSRTWTGQELIVWGGAIPFGGSFDDGAAYDPVSGEWRELASSPLRARVGHTAIWTRNEMIIWGGHGGGSITGRPTSHYIDGAAYDPSVDTWRQISDSPLTGGPGYSAVWTGKEMIVMGGNDGYLSAAENGLSEAAAYDPSTDSWRAIEFPSPMLMIDAVWTGTEVVFYGVRFYLGELIGFSYNPVTDVFGELPAAPFQAAVPDIEMVGNRVVAWSYDPEVDGIAVLNLATEEWELLPDFPGRPTEGIPIGAALGPDHILVQSEAVTAIYSFVSGEWETVSPATGEGGPFTLAPIWTGEEALFYVQGPELWAYTPNTER